VQAHQVYASWAESQVNRDNRRTGVPWKVQYGKIGGGTDSLGTDANGTMESTMLFQTGQTNTWKTWDLSALTQKWVSNTTPNLGVMLWATNEDTDYNTLWFRSSEYSNSTYWPKLEVTYSTDSATKTVYFLKDHLGSIRAAVLDSAGAPVIGYDDYDPWGYPLATRTKAIPTAYLQGASKNKFTGKKWDDEFGVNLYNFPARDYDPMIGRWLSVDPVANEFPNYSPYNYAYNNPLAFNDPTGKSGEAVIERDKKGKETGNVIVSANLIFYGSQATPKTAQAITNEIQTLYNAVGATVSSNGKNYDVKFNVTFQVVSEKQAQQLASGNTDIKNNFVEISESNEMGRSFMDLGGNSGSFVTTDNLGTSTTASHEYGHGLGLEHSSSDQRGKGQPDIMAARGTLVDPKFQYNPSARANSPGGTINPALRKVTQQNIQDIFRGVTFDRNGKVNIGRITNTIY